jgi:hypothetical protein
MINLTLSDLKVRRFLRNSLAIVQEGAVKTPLDVQNNYLSVLQLRLLLVYAFVRNVSTLSQFGTLTILRCLQCQASFSGENAEGVLLPGISPF